VPPRGRGLGCRRASDYTVERASHLLTYGRAALSELPGYCAPPHRIGNEAILPGPGYGLRQMGRPVTAPRGWPVQMVIWS